MLSSDDAKKYRAARRATPIVNTPTEHYSSLAAGVNEGRLYDYMVGWETNDSFFVMFAASP